MVTARKTRARITYSLEKMASDGQTTDREQKTYQLEVERKDDVSDIEIVAKNGRRDDIQPGRGRAVCQIGCKYKPRAGITYKLEVERYGACQQGQSERGNYVRPEGEERGRHVSLRLR